MPRQKEQKSSSFCHHWIINEKPLCNFLREGRALSDRSTCNDMLDNASSTSNVCSVAVVIVWVFGHYVCDYREDGSSGSEMFFFSCVRE